MTTGNAPPIEEQIDALYKRGWNDSHQEKDYDPRKSIEWQTIRDSLKKLAALEKPVPVEPVGEVTDCGVSAAVYKSAMLSDGDLLYPQNSIDALQSALQRAQEERDKWKAEADGQFQYAGRLLEELHKAESLNRRMVEKYRDLVVAAEKIGGKVTDASNLQISIADVLSMKEALAKLEEA